MLRASGPLSSLSFVSFVLHASEVKAGVAYYYTSGLVYWYSFGTSINQCSGSFTAKFGEIISSLE